GEPVWYPCHAGSRRAGRAAILSLASPPPIYLGALLARGKRRGAFPNGVRVSMSTLIDSPLAKHRREKLDQAVIRFAGDSGDGMQITGSQFTNTVALYGNDI